MGIGFAAQLIGRMGGSVHFGDASERGNARHVSMPFTKAEVPQQLETQQGGRLGGLNILLAEDNKVNHMVAARPLRRGGYTVAIAENGEQALAAMACGSFDLALMDIQMFSIYGLEATKVLRKREGDREKCLAAGMGGYVPKPLHKQGFFEALS